MVQSQAYEDWWFTMIRHLKIILTKLLLGVLCVLGMMVVCWLLSAMFHPLTPWRSSGAPAW